MPDMTARQAALKCAEMIERKAQSLVDDPEHGYSEGDTNAFIWTDHEAEWQWILLDELATEFRAFADTLRDTPMEAMRLALMEIAELDEDCEHQRFKLTRFQASQVARRALLALRDAPEAVDYKVLWERDSSSLGKCLQEIHTLRAVKEDRRARIAVLEGELAAAHAARIADQRDAARYRWLRKANIIDWDSFPWPNGYEHPDDALDSAEQMTDAAIDAAMETAKK